MTLRGIKKTGISQRTISHDIQNIQSNMGIDIWYSRTRNGYFIESADMRSDVERYLDSFDVFTALSVNEDIPDFVFVEKYRPRGTHHLFSLIHAVRNTLQIRFSYGNFQDKTLSECHLEPYALKECRGRWYLVGRTVGQQDMKSYGLDRISNLVIMKVQFKKDASANLTEKFRHSYGIDFTNEYPVEEVILSFDAEDGRFLKYMPLHHSQKIVKDTEEEFVIKLQLKITLEFVMEILSYSWSLKVIKPVTLQEQICEIYQKALKRNEEKQ
jgi:predicted DNA-binding transcriptional regulator YafY